MTDDSNPTARPSNETTPTWVANVRARPRTAIGATVAFARRAYRVAVTIGVILLWPTLVYVWVVPTTVATAAARAGLAIALAFLVPVLVLKWGNPTTTTFMWLVRPRAAARAARGPRPHATWVALGDIAPAMQLAVIVSEDPYFFWHLGFNPIEIVRAHRHNRDNRGRGRNLRGGSTITQQLAKNLFLSPAQSYVRKLLEAVFTALMEGLWSKRRILEIYLNVVQFGVDVFGVEAAAEHFFRCRPSALSAEQAALLTAALRGPRVYRVDDPSPAMRDLQTSILQRMGWCGEGMLEQLAER